MEGVLLKDLRNHYIPECILAYNSALWFAGHFISRNWLVECMELAQVVAQTPMLTEAFVEGGRMKELVRAFAIDSEALLQASEQGGPKTKKMKTDKGNSEIWKVSWKDEGPLDLEALD
jgi:nuclear pore complex protein Nup107